MASADIVRIGLDELPLIVDLYNEVFRPGCDATFFKRRLGSCASPLILLAQVGGQPAGFAIGYEAKPNTFYCWLIGVLQHFRHSGIASQLMEALAAWAFDNDYQVIRFECYNHHRPMLRLAIRQHYDIVGIRYDADASANLIILEHTPGEARDGD